MPLLMFGNGRARACQRVGERLSDSLECFLWTADEAKTRLSYYEKITVYVLFPIIPMISDASGVGGQRISDVDKKTSNEAFVQAPNNRIVDLNFDESTAIKIAEAVLVYIYGDVVLDQRPWRVIDAGSEFKIEGKIVENHWGGNAEIVIRKSDAKVISFCHTK